MARVDFNRLVKSMKGQIVDRPNRASSGTLSDYAAGEPFEKCEKLVATGAHHGSLFKANPDHFYINWALPCKYNFMFVTWTNHGNRRWKNGQDII